MAMVMDMARDRFREMSRKVANLLDIIKKNRSILVLY